MTPVAQRSFALVTDIPAPRRTSPELHLDARELGEIQVITCRQCAANFLQTLRAGRQAVVLVSPDGQPIARLRLAVDDVAPSTYRSSAGPIEVDWSARTLANGSRQQTLSATEMRIFEVLVKCAGAVVPRAELIRKVWPQSDVHGSRRSNDLAVYICGLRKRLGALNMAHTLQTVRGIGYRLDL